MADAPQNEAEEESSDIDVHLLSLQHDRKLAFVDTSRVLSKGSNKIRCSRSR